MNEAKVIYLKPDATEFDNALSQLAVALADGVPHKLIEDLLVLGEDMDNLRYVDSYPTNASVITISIKLSERFLHILAAMRTNKVENTPLVN